MATALALHSRVDAGSYYADDEIEQALAAACRLVGATAIDLIEYRREDGDAEIVATSGGNPASLTPDLLASMEGETTFLLREPSSRWKTMHAPGAGDSLLVKLSDQPSTTLFLLVSLSDAAGIARARALRLVPDLMTLVRLYVGLTARTRDLEEVRSAAIKALDHGECGVIALRADHSVLFANAAASAHLADEVGLRLRRGVLRPTDRGSASRFEAALDQVIEPEGEQDSRMRPRARMLLLGGARPGRRPTIIVIAPASSVIGQDGSAKGAVVLLYILQPSQGAVRGLDTLCQLHGLSRVESQLIAHLMSGLTLTEAAVEMRVKSETVRTYLKQVFAKTGLHRQADLTALMTRYLRAVRGDFDFQPA